MSVRFRRSVGTFAQPRWSAPCAVKARRRSPPLSYSRARLRRRAAGSADGRPAVVATPMWLTWGVGVGEGVGCRHVHEPAPSSASRAVSSTLAEGVVVGELPGRVAHGRLHGEPTGRGRCCACASPAREAPAGALWRRPAGLDKERRHHASRRRSPRWPRGAQQSSPSSTKAEQQLAQQHPARTRGTGLVPFITASWDAGSRPSRSGRGQPTNSISRQHFQCRRR